jgi:hypothetical protein
MTEAALRIAEGSGTALAEQMRSAKADGEDCLKLRSPTELNAASSAAEQMEGLVRSSWSV